MLHHSAAAAAYTLAVGAAGGGLFAFLGLPAGWLAGSALATAAVSLAGGRLYVPPRLRFAALVVMGMAMGSAMTPQMMGMISHWPGSLVLMLISVFASFAIGTIYLRRVHGWDRATARLCATPGALSTVLALASESRANVPVVAVSHALRQFFLMCLVPLFFAMQPHATFTRQIAGWGDLALMITAALAVALLFKTLKVPAALLTGAMVGSAAVHLTGIVEGAPTPLLQNAGFVVLGAITGSAFSGVSHSILRRALLPSLGCIIVSCAVALAFALLAFWMLGIAPTQLILSYAPGGVEGMNALAIAMSLDPAFVSVHHFVRLFALMLLSPIWAAGIMAPPLAEGRMPNG